jgi:glycosyltransferase involved in cell wall biosynthesis
MKVSIAVPSFNYGRFIDACLRSIRDQDYSDFEVLIADGGSEDDSLRTIEQFCALDERFHLVSRSDSGQVDAIRRAFSHASGDIFCFLNADDLYLSTAAFSSTVDVFKSNPQVGLVSFGGYYVDAAGKIVRRVRLRYHPLDTLSMMKYRSGALQPATFWTRLVHESVALKPEYDYSFDTVFFYEAWTRFQWLERPEKIIAGYRIHGANKSVQIIPQRVEELARFEQMKFGAQSFRARYLMGVGQMLALAASIPLLGTHLRKLVRIGVNGLAFLTVYRLPSI